MPVQHPEEEPELDELSHLDDEAGLFDEQRPVHQSLHWLQRPSIVMIGLCIFFMTFAVSSAESSRRVIQYKLACNSVAKKTGSDTCDANEAQILLLTLQQALLVTLGITNILALAKVPTLSDQYGRKRFVNLLIASLLLGKYLRYLVTAWFPVTKFTLTTLSEAIGSSFGGTVGFLTLCNCYASDISLPGQRIHYLGIVMAFFYAGQSLGPMAGNFLLSYFPPDLLSGMPTLVYGPGLTAHEFLPLRFELIVLTALLFFSAFVLPESRSSVALRMSQTASQSLLRPEVAPGEESARQKLWRTLNIFRPLRIIFYPKDCVNPSRHDSIVAHRLAIFIIIMLDCGMVGFGMSLGEVFVLNGIYRHHMTALDLGLLLVISCTCRALLLTVMLPILRKKVLVGYFGFSTDKRRFDMVDYSMVSIAFVVELFGLVAVALARSKYSYLACFAFTAVGSLASPALSSAAIKFFPESKIGEVFGAIALAKNLFIISFSVSILAAYKMALKNWERPEIVFYAVSAFFFAMFLAATYAIFVLEQEDVDKERRDTSMCLVK
ncbi:hypothetical protein METBISCDRAFT_25643 [Metschnikowia bicuspidata]|uniref:MFS general substrate transporter n=1 Tax=Metschnikowia bicuspidata TaxID=27322 RepID=A0A4P9ZH10_9ASCO|nr:hypothetical protein METBISCDRAFT_25643 [Metschnikowia bicuspidata]